MYVLRVIDMDRSVTFYRDMLRLISLSYDPEQRTARLLTPDGVTLFLTADPELDVAALLRREGAVRPGETPVPPEEEGRQSHLWPLHREGSGRPVVRSLSI